MVKPGAVIHSMQHHIIECERAPDRQYITVFRSQDACARSVCTFISLVKPMVMRGPDRTDTHNCPTLLAWLVSLLPLFPALIQTIRLTDFSARAFTKNTTFTINSTWGFFFLHFTPWNRFVCTHTLRVIHILQHKLHARQIQPLQHF